MSDHGAQPPSAPINLPPEKVEILHELNQAFAGDRELIKNYLQKFGWSKVVAPNVRIIRREATERNELFERVKSGSVPLTPKQPGAVAAAPEKPQKKEVNEHGERSPYYQNDVGCPFCDTRFTTSILRSKSLIMEFTYKDPQFPLMVPHAKGTVKGFILEDPLIRSIIICPNCLYASSVIGNFVHDPAAGARTMKARIPDRKLAALREAMLAGMEQRRAFYAEKIQLPSGDAVWGESRTKEHAIVAFRLAASSALIMADFDPLALFQSAEATLSAAKLTSELDRAEEETACFREVIPILEKFYQIGSVSATPHYLIAVLSYHLGDFETARTWIGRMIAQRNKLEGSSKYRRFAENLKDEVKKKIGD